jgi:U4/U6 small nuclear ribonucleoprotein PRP3
MNILADAAVQDPSQIERKVRKAYEDRYKKMILENEKNKLTKEQKAEKIRKKFEKDIKKDCKACLFKITTVLDKKNKFKIDKNAQQLYLTGVFITNKRNNVEKIPSFIYVEGGPLALKKFKILLLRRIKWENINFSIQNNNSNSSYNNMKEFPDDNKMIFNDDKVNGEDKNDINMNINTTNNGNSNSELKNSKNCMHVWEGTIKKRAFEKWKLMEVTSEIRARKILSDKGMEHYWNLLQSFKFEEE